MDACREDQKTVAVTVQELNELIEKIKQQEEKIEEQSKVTKALNTELAKMEIKAAAFLDELGQTEFKSPHGTIKIKEKWRFNLPESDEAKAEFFDYLRAKGMFDALATVNSNSYNAFLLKEWDIAKEEGRGMDFHIPGVPEPKFYRSLERRKK